MMIVSLGILLAASRLSGLDQTGMDEYLAQLEAREPRFDARLVAIAKDSVGTPYADGPLGEGPAGKFDKDPLMDIARVDCVTFIEQSIALAASKTYAEAFDTLQTIRYRDGRVDYEARNHFMETDWIPNNPFCRDVTKDLRAATQSVTRTISRQGFFKRVGAEGLGKDTPDRAVEVAYIPCADVEAAEPSLPNPALILFVGKVDWLFAVHCGLYIREDGHGKLYHASSKTPREVTAVDFDEHLRDSTRVLGFTAYSIAPPGKR